MRSVKNLLGIELLHNLYNQHISKVNAIRFRNTAIFWNKGIAKSYAHIDEWNMLSNWVARRFFIGDKFFLREIENLVLYDKTFLFSILKKIQKTNLKKASNIGLGLLLIDMQHTVFGEIYPVNLVQLEYSLTHAINMLLVKYEKNENLRSQILSSMITTTESTESVKEDIAFERILSKGRRLHANDPFKNKNVLALIKKHYENYAFMQCAYGEEPRTLDFYIQRYKSRYLEKEVKKHKISNSKVYTINDPYLRKLCVLMKKIGTFRDFNKSILGKTMKYKYEILEEISKRKLESRENLNYYLLIEILDLLQKKKKLTKKEINYRKKNGVVFVRSENMASDEKSLKIKINKPTVLKGVCASPGKVQGKCKIILSKEDIPKLTKDDIMIAIGTDFDLLEAIHRAKAVVTEEGGILSHASVVCRELKKPCCIGVKDATSVLSDGLLIELDATLGRIFIK